MCDTEVTIEPLPIEPVPGVRVVRLLGPGIIIADPSAEVSVTISKEDN